MLTMPFAIKWVSLLAVFGKRRRSSLSSSITRRLLSRVRCICRTRIEGWCCSSRDLFSVAVPCQFPSSLQKRERDETHEYQFVQNVCTYFLKKKKDKLFFCITVVFNLYSAGIFLCRVTRLKFICRRAWEPWKFVRCDRANSICDNSTGFELVKLYVYVCDQSENS